MPDVLGQSKKVVTIVIGLVVLFALLPIFLPFFTINYGQVGVVTQFGKIARTASPGLNFKIPFVESVVRFRTQKIIYETSEQTGVSNADYKDDPVDTSTEDGQQVSIRYTVRFRLLPEKIQSIAENLGSENQVVERVIKANSRSTVRNVAREFKAEQLYTGNVFTFQDKVSQTLSESLAKNGLELDEFLVRQVNFGEEYVSAVEQKQIERERVKTEEYKADQEKFRKQQAITKAEGEAKAQEILKLSLDSQLLQKLAIDKWNGILPTYYGSGALPFLNLNR